MTFSLLMAWPPPVHDARSGAGERIAVNLSLTKSTHQEHLPVHAIVGIRDRRGPRGGRHIIRATLHQMNAVAEPGAPFHIAATQAGIERRPTPFQSGANSAGKKLMVRLKTRTAASAGLGAPSPALGPSAGLLLLGACAALGPPGVETSRVYADASPEGLYERTLDALQASDLEVTKTDRARGTITAVGRFEARNWAECPQPQRIVENQEDQELVVGAREDYRRVELSASVQGDQQGARLTLDPAFTAEPVSALATTTECRTTGALERQILEAVAEAA